ncbi:Phosphatidylserine decarboxylase proenzyme 1, mitochondrial [Erysiphe neolycopersici]|uniref:Phosphatidylserine decarboxylase proenzyme 1, mitochondrial n=1 Tax=Erysiphe neolycopersici TaxID=212602 RepID=A0A420HP16_9PEZI|nr:Phosphatidylserine decarboxylase proenzyme 1, mitochondrial [Erysiphe neolycopersici]
MSLEQAAKKIDFFLKRCYQIKALNQSRRLESGTRSSIRQYRVFSSDATLNQQQLKITKSFQITVKQLLGKIRAKWVFFPFTLGLCSYGVFETLKFQNEKGRIQGKCESSSPSSDNSFNKTEDNQYKRDSIRLNRPWQVQVMSTLPLKAISRIWGRFNEFEIPYYLRVPGFKLYSYIFGVNLSEASESDLHSYPNLASFFYRSLKPGLRPLDTNPNSLVSPADGRVLQFGLIDGGEVEQVKGVTYSLEALLGRAGPEVASQSQKISDTAPKNSVTAQKYGEENIKHNEEFARVNDVPYTLVNLFSGSTKQPKKTAEDASTTPNATSEAEACADLALTNYSWYPKLHFQNRAQKTALYYIVIYLAPGDYHRFHSPCSWVVESRRHFAGELYSVSPYVQRMLPGLFTLNERVVLLGRWRWGFFSYIPVGATNVGSIKINFDRKLKTNSLLTDTAADLAAKEAAERGEPYCGYSEATYEAASPSLRGYALSRGEEMGGFMLGSTIVLVFEAAKGERPSLDEGWMGESSKRRGGWQWAVERGQKIKMGQALGWVDE